MCVICGVKTTGEYCPSCEAHKNEIDNYAATDHKPMLERMMKMPSHLYFYAIRQLVRHPKLGDSFNKALLEADDANNKLYFRRLQGYRNNFADCDRWDTNPLTA